MYNCVRERRRLYYSPSRTLLSHIFFASEKKNIFLAREKKKGERKCQTVFLWRGLLGIRFNSRPSAVHESISIPLSGGKVSTVEVLGDVGVFFLGAAWVCSFFRL